jgi:hypothetical protein
MEASTRGEHARDQMQRTVATDSRRHQFWEPAARSAWGGGGGRMDGQEDELHGNQAEAQEDVEGDGVCPRQSLPAC